MTVAELIEKLKTFDPSLPVVTPGFDEWGYDDIQTVAMIELVKVPPAPHGPTYEESDRREKNGEEPIGPSFKAVLIDWSNHVS